MNSFFKGIFFKNIFFGWILLVTLAPFGIITYLETTTSYNALHNEITKNLSLIAKMKGTNIENFIIVSKNNATQAANSPFVIAATKELLQGESDKTRMVKELNEYLANIIQQYHYVDIMILSPLGKVIYSKNQPNMIGRDYSEIPLETTELGKTFDNAKTLLGTSLSNFQQTPQYKEPQLYIGSPILGESKNLLGVLIIQMNNVDIAKVIGDTEGLGDTGETIVGTVEMGQITPTTPLRHTSIAEFMSKEKSNTSKKMLANFRNATLGEKGVGGFVDYRGKEVLASWRYLPSMNWGMLVKIDSEESLQPLISFTKNIFIMGALTFIFAVILAYLVALKLQNTLDSLNKTQRQLIESEKMASLGNLVAGVAHEINTPLGAINASTSNIMHSLTRAFGLLPTVMQNLSSEKLAYFYDLLKRSLKSKIFLLSSREERQYKNMLMEKLEQNKIESVDIIADRLVEMGIYADIDRYIPFLRDKNNFDILQLAYNFHSIYKNVSNIGTSVSQTSKIIFALRNYSHYEHSDEKVLANVRDGIEIVLTLYYNQLKHGIQVIKNYQEVPDILCYVDELNQVWSNLIQNAIYAMKQEGTLTISILNRQDHILVAIADTGSGIPPAAKPRIFEPFFTTKRRGEGTGLGLSIIKKIIEKHNGNIQVESEPGKTIFTVALPINSLPTGESNRSNHV